MNRRKTLRDIYKEYPYINDASSIYYVEQMEYININKDFYTLLSLYLIETGQVYKFPGGLGELKIRKRKPPMDQQKIDYKRSKEAGKELHFMNMHSNGYYARFKWYKNRISLAQKNTFKFVPVRWAKRSLAKAIKERNTIIRYNDI